MRISKLVFLLLLTITQGAFSTPTCYDINERTRIEQIAKDVTNSLVGKYGIEAVRVRNCDVQWVARVLRLKTIQINRADECGLYLTFSSATAQSKFAEVVRQENGNLRGQNGQLVRVCGAVAR